MEAEKLYASRSVSFYIGDVSNTIDVDKCKEHDSKSRSEIPDDNSDKINSDFTSLNNSSTPSVPCTTASQRLIDGSAQLKSSRVTEELRCLSARPNSRVWEASLTGEVARIHQLASALPQVPALDIYDLDIDMQLSDDEAFSTSDSTSGNGNLHADRNSQNELLINSHYQNVYERQTRSNCSYTLLRGSDSTGENEFSSESSSDLCNNVSKNNSELLVTFSQMLRFQEKFILLISASGIFCIDPNKAALVFSLNVHCVGHVVVCGNSLMYSKPDGTVTRLTFVPAEVAVISLHSLGLMRRCAHLAAENTHLFNESPVLTRIKKVVIRDLLEVTKGTKYFKVFEKLSTETKELDNQSTAEPYSLNYYVPFDNGVTSRMRLGKGTSDVRYGFNNRRVSLTSDTPPRQNSADSYQGNSPLSPKPRMAYNINNTNYVRSFYGMSSYGAFPIAAGEACSVLQDLMGSVASNVTASKVGNAASNMSSSLLSSVSKFAVATTPAWCDPTLFSKLTLGMQEATTSLNENCKPLNVLENISNYKTPSDIRDHVNGVDIMTNVKSIMESSVPNLKSTLLNNLNPQTIEGKVINSAIQLNGIKETHANPMETFVVERNPRKKKKKCKKNASSVEYTSTEKSNSVSNSPASKSPIPQFKNVELLTKSLISFAILVTELNKKISDLENSVFQISFLNNWLPVYVNILNELNNCKNASNGLSDGDPSLSYLLSPDSARMLRHGVSELLVHCITHRNSLRLPELSDSLHQPHDALDSHIITPEHDTRVDSFFATVIYNSQDLIDFEHMINSFDSTGVGYYCKMWCVLMFRVTENMSGGSTKNNFVLDLFENIDFTRAQRLMFLRACAESMEWSRFTDAASKLRQPSVIFDVIFSTNFAVNKNTNPSHSTAVNDIKSPASNETKTKSTERSFSQIADSLIDPSDVLFRYLQASASQCNIHFYYVQHWCSSRELQYDIVKCILQHYSSTFEKCKCGFATAASSYTELPLLELLRVITESVLYDPVDISQLCLQHSYWRGYCSIMLRHNLDTNQPQFIALSLQTHCSHTIALLMQSVQTASQCDQLIRVLVAISSANAKMSCWKCRSVLSASTDDHYTIDERELFIKTQTDYNCDNNEQDNCPWLCNLTVKSWCSPISLSAVWVKVVHCVLARLGALCTLQLLQDHLHHGSNAAVVPHR